MESGCKMPKSRQNPGLPEDTGPLASELVSGKKRPESMQASAGVAPAISPSAEEALNSNQAIVVYFQREAGIQSLLASLASHPTREILEVQAAPATASCVLVTASEFLLAEHADTLSKANLRVVALADRPFRDAKADRLVYAYLSEATPPSLIERMIDNAADHIRLDQKCRTSDELVAGVTREIQELNHIG